MKTCCLKNNILISSINFLFRFLPKMNKIILKLKIILRPFFICFALFCLFPFCFFSKYGTLYGAVSSSSIYPPDQETGFVESLLIFNRLPENLQSNKRVKREQKTNSSNKENENKFTNVGGNTGATTTTPSAKTTREFLRKEIHGRIVIKIGHIGAMVKYIGNGWEGRGGCYNMWL